MAPAAVAHRPLVSLLHDVSPCTESYTYDAEVWALSIVLAPFYVAPCTNPTRPIRSTHVAVRHRHRCGLLGVSPFKLDERLHTAKRLLGEQEALAALRTDPRMLLMEPQRLERGWEVLSQVRPHHTLPYGGVI
jgi:hypothetical protein